MRPLAEDFKDILNEIKDYNFFIAGGAIACAYFEVDAPNQDLDIYFRTENDFFQNNANYKEMVVTQNAITFKKKDKSSDSLFGESESVQITSNDRMIQLIRRNFGTPEGIIADFDINKSMIALDIKNKKIIHDDRFFEPLKIYNMHINTLKRIAKYAYRSNERYDWVSLIKIFYSDINIDDYYSAKFKKSKLYLEGFLKSYITSPDINDITKNDISNALLEYSHDAEFLEFLVCVFIPYNLNTENIVLQILYYKYFSKSNLTRIHLDKNGLPTPNPIRNIIMNNLKKYFVNVKEIAPEALF